MENVIMKTSVIKLVNMMFPPSQEEFYKAICHGICPYDIKKGTISSELKVSEQKASQFIQRGIKEKVIGIRNGKYILKRAPLYNMINGVYRDPQQIIVTSTINEKLHC